MKINKTDIIKYIKVKLPVRYEEEDIPNDFPFRNNDVVEFIIEHPIGKIIDFPLNYIFPKYWTDENWKDKDFENKKVFHLGMKVVDTGSYYILDKDKNIISSLEEEYVPDTNSISGKWGDYIDFKIDFSSGVIKNWKKKATFKEFKNEEFENYFKNKP